MRGDRARLLAAVEQQRGAAALDPRASLHERCLVDVATEHDVGMMAVEKAGKLGIAEVFAAGPRQWTLGWTVVHPHPRTRPPRRGAVKHVVETLQCLRTLPPRAHRHQPPTNVDAVTVDRNTAHACLVQPYRRLLAI